MFKVAPFRSNNGELAIRFDVTGHRFIRELIQETGIYIGGNPANVFEELKIDNTQLILVTCHGSKSGRGAFRDDDKAINLQFRWTAQEFFDKLKAKIGFSQPVLTVLFAQCYGELMAQDLRALIANDSTATCWANVEVLGLSSGKTLKKVIRAQALGLQTLHYDFLFFCLSKVHDHFSKDDLLALIGEIDHIDSTRNPHMSHIQAYRTYVNIFKDNDGNNIALPNDLANNLDVDRDSDSNSDPEA